MNEDLTGPEERTRTKSWSDQCDDEDSLDWSLAKLEFNYYGYFNNENWVEEFSTWDCCSQLYQLVLEEETLFHQFTIILYNWLC